MSIRVWVWALALTTGCYSGLDEGSPAADDGEDGDSEGEGESEGDSDGETLDCTQLRVGPGDLVRLTITQYDNTVRDLLGIDLGQADATFASDVFVGQFTVGAPVEPLVAKQLVLAAEAIADALDPNALVPCDAATGDDACADAFITSFGRRAFRHDLSTAEVDTLREIYELGDDFPHGIRLVVQAVLQSPQVVYMMIPDTADAQPGDVVALDDFSIASRLSYTLWNTMPDDALLDAAAEGSLSTDEGLAAAVDRMLADPRAEDGVMEFYDHVLHADLVGTVAKNPGTFPDFDAQLARDLQDSFEAGLLALHFGERPGTVAALLSGLPLLANDHIADYYGWTRDDPSQAWGPVTAPGAHRGGILSHPALASLLARPTAPAIVERGLFVREQLLCSPLPPPPPGVETEVPEPSESATPREWFEEHRANPECSGCHNLIDPLGYGMEQYDADGRWRDTYPGGQPVDASGELITATAQPFTDLAELESLLSTDPAVVDCMVDHWLSYAARRELVSDDDCSRQALREALDQSGGSLDALVRATVMSDGFRHVTVPQ
ncbi:MAG: DUF1592 domain-containing protein [Deltaproteobacteria bacterium]|nr:DUF1592 domain-containing protein [Deltaproteobacteria bacterium]